MTLLEHLRELRTRLFRASLAVVAGVIIGYLIHNYLLHILQDPYCSLSEKQVRNANHGALPAGWQCQFVVLKVTDPLLLTLKISLYAGLIVSSPFWMYQIWAFVAPGLHRSERKWAYVFAASPRRCSRPARCSPSSSCRRAWSSW